LLVGFRLCRVLALNFSRKDGRRFGVFLQEFQAVGFELGVVGSGRPIVGCYVK
jgi:hypothetical protein